MDIHRSFLDWAIEFSNRLVDPQHFLQINFTLDNFTIFHFFLLSLKRNYLFNISLVNKKNILIDEPNVLMLTLL